MTRFTRVFTCLHKEARAAFSSANEANCSSRLVCVGTRSALASFTVDSVPPLLAGSAGAQVLMLTE